MLILLDTVADMKEKTRKNLFFSNRRRVGGKDEGNKGTVGAEDYRTSHNCN